MTTAIVTHIAHTPDCFCTVWDRVGTNLTHYLHREEYHIHLTESKKEN